MCGRYSAHVEFTHYKKLNNFRQELGTGLRKVEANKSLAPSNVKKDMAKYRTRNLG